MTSPADQLRAAKALIDTPEKWTQGEYARDAYGEFVSHYGDNCKCFCAVGALSRTEGENSVFQGARDALLAAAKERGASTVVAFNDSYRTTHADIMALFDRAITLASTGGQDRG